MTDKIDKVRDWNYKVLRKIGTGGYGEVYQCRDRKKRKNVAIKVVCTTDEFQGVDASVIREVSLLLSMDHENIIKLLKVHNDGKYIYLVFEHMDTDLKVFIKSTPRTSVDPILRKKFLRQILNGVAYCHSQNVLHRDLKPGNVLVNLRKETLKLADFGLARSVGIPAEGYSSQIATPSYRAPEILFGTTKYTAAVDIWAVGCIFAEMERRTPIFHRGYTNEDQLLQIFRLLGTPNEETWPGVSSLCDYFVLIPVFRPKDLAEQFPDLEPTGVDLLYKMFCLNPEKRITAHEALQHPYFQEA